MKRYSSVDSTGQACIKIYHRLRIIRFLAGKFRMVIYVEDYWNTLMEVHDKQLFHAGYRKTFHKACHSSIVTVI